MKLHELRISGFGPYPGTVQVDFDTLGEDGLFLLHGDTGAGKTSLLDAVAFALYGRVPGVRQDAARLRSDRTPATRPTVVELEFSVGAHRFRVARSPEYLRPKSRGTGMTKAHAKVTLTCIGQPPPGYTEGYIGARDVGDRILELLGMSAEQFFQVVLLPQGEFAQFLRAGTDDRERLLEKLFDTRQFADIEDWFTEARRISGASVRAEQETIGGHRARVAEAAGSEQGDTEEDEWAGGLRDRTSDLADLAAAESRWHGEQSAVGEANLIRLRGDCELQIRKTELLTEQRVWELADHQRAGWREDLRRYALAGPIAAAAADARSAAVDLAAAQAARDRARALVAARFGTSRRIHGVDVATGWFDAGDQVRAVQAGVQMRVGALDAVIAAAATQDDEVRSITETTTTIERLTDRRSVLDEREARHPERLQAADGALIAARAAAASLSGLTATRDQLRTRLAAAQRVDHLAAASRAATDAAQSAMDATHVAVDRRQHLVQLRMAGMAAELAAALVNGEPCVVCGATEHPRPSVSESESATAQQIAAAERAEAAAVVVRDGAVALRAQARAAYEAALTAAGDANAADLRGAVQDADSSCSAAASAAATVPAQEQLLADLRAEAESTSCLRQEIEREIALRNADLQRWLASTRERAERLDAARGNHPTVALHQEFLVAAARELTVLADAISLAEREESRNRLAGTRVETLLAASPFVHLDEVATAAGIDADSTARMLRESEDVGTRLAGLLADPALRDLAPAPDIEQLREQVARAAEDVDRVRVLATQAYARAGSSRTRAERVVANIATLTRARHASHRIIDRDRKLAALTEVIQGKGANRLALSLRTFVLASRLQEVAVAANHRLTAMTGGRYTFVHSREKEARGRSGGLGLDILDAHSGLSRSAKTLSGGESFLASLALALGLADVVAGEAGARVLDTLFIDEGFGSLDNETLDLVMSTLDELRTGGRTVGVVSHVDELRQRIPSRLQVHKGAEGSHLTMTTAG